MLENLKVRGLILTIVGCISWLAIYIFFLSPIDVQYVPISIRVWVQGVSMVIALIIFVVCLYLYYRTKPQIQFSIIPLVFLAGPIAYSFVRVLVSLVFHPEYGVGISIDALSDGVSWTILMILTYLFLRGVDLEELGREETVESFVEYDDPFEEESGSG